MIALLSAFLDKEGTNLDKMKLERRKMGAIQLEKDIADWQEQAYLGHRSFKGKEDHILIEKAKMGLPGMVPILIVVPASVVDNWDYEFTMWGHFSTTVYRDASTQKEALDAIRYGRSEILLCGHSLFGTASHIKDIKSISWKLVVVDEFHGMSVSC